MFGREKKPKRFKVIHDESSSMRAFTIFQDTETGVNYVYTGSGYGGGLTVLVDRDGKPIVTQVENEDAVLKNKSE